jgi:hypothetical protein
MIDIRKFDDNYFQSRRILNQLRRVRSKKGNFKQSETHCFGTNFFSSNSLKNKTLPSIRLVNKKNE